MKIWARIQSLSIQQLWKLIVVFLKHPFYVLPTLRATKETMNTCNTLYGDAHFRSGKANAFRHAYWNFMICLQTQKIAQNEEKSINWAENFTSLYENVTQNEKMDQFMDFHNNEVGRLVFLKKKDLKQEEIIDFFAKMSEKATKIEQIEHFHVEKDQLIYIEN